MGSGWWERSSGTGTDRVRHHIHPDRVADRRTQQLGLAQDSKDLPLKDTPSLDADHSVGVSRGNGKRRQRPASKTDASAKIFSGW